MRILAILALALIAAGTSAQAQVYQCHPPAGPVSVPAIVPDGPVRRVPVTGYTLALSWSPEYCRAGSGVDTFQCSRRNGRFGLVLHGLWPEGRGAAWPQWCPTARAPTPALLRQNMCMTPSAALLAHEWAKHGACMARTPDAYFKRAQAMWSALHLPDLDRVSHQDDLTAGAIRESFTVADPTLKPGMIGIGLNPRGWLQEVKICYGKDLRPTLCTPRQLGAADSAPAKIWRGL